MADQICAWVRRGVANDRGALRASASLAGASYGASESVVTGSPVVILNFAPRFGVAEVLCAGVSVIADEHSALLAGARAASVSLGAL